MLIDSVQIAFFALDEGKAAIKGRPSANAVTISAPISLSGKWLVPRLHTLSELAPEIELRVDASDALVDLGEGAANLAIRYCRKPPNDLLTHLLLPDTVFPVCAPSAVAAFDAAQTNNSQFPVALPLLHDRMADFTWADWFEGEGKSRDQARAGPTFSHSGNALDAAIAGQSIALGRLALIANDLACGRLVRPFLGEGTSSYSYYLLQPRRARANRKIDVVIAWLLKEAQETSHFVSTCVSPCEYRGQSITWPT